MTFLLFLRGLIGVLVVFAVASYAITGSLVTTLINTALCAVLIQLGYFLAVLFLVWRAGSPDRPAEPASGGETPAAKKPVPLPGVGRSPLR